MKLVERAVLAVVTLSALIGLYLVHPMVGWAASGALAVFIIGRSRRTGVKEI